MKKRRIRRVKKLLPVSELKRRRAKLDVLVLEGKLPAYQAEARKLRLDRLIEARS